MRLIVTTCAAFALSNAVCANAQDVGAEPAMGTIVLEANFPEDPYTAIIFSGGTIDASVAIPGCSGFISEPPDIRLTFTADPGPSALPLFIHAVSEGDTTLVINAPDGNWYCNDDGGDAMNPMVVFGPALSGDYEIWLGSYEEGANHEATLAISEIGASPESVQTPDPDEAGR